MFTTLLWLFVLIKTTHLCTFSPNENNFQKKLEKFGPIKLAFLNRFFFSVYFFDVFPQLCDQKLCAICTVRR